MTSSTGMKIRWQNAMFQTEEVSAEYPVVGGIYRDTWNRSFVVLTISGNEALLEYADGSVATVRLGNWHRLHPQSAGF